LWRNLSCCNICRGRFADEDQGYFIIVRKRQPALGYASDQQAGYGRVGACPTRRAFSIAGWFSGAAASKLIFLGSI
jgi:hypothetical protein